MSSLPSKARLAMFTDAQMSRSPDNIAPICAYLASERSSWLSGRTIAAGGFEVDLYSNPEIIASAKSDGPWSLEDLATDRLPPHIKDLARSADAWENP